MVGQVSREAATEFRTSLVGMRRLVEQEISTFVHTYRDARDDEWWKTSSASEEFALVMRGIVERYGEAGAAFAAEWYDDARATVQASGRFRAELFASSYLDAVDGTVQRALFQQVVSDDPDDVTAAIIKTLQSTIPKYTLDAPRRTIMQNTSRDPQAQGWQRVTRAGACSFCDMLAGRGGVYKRETVHFASHGDCNCGAVPSWDPSAPEVDVELYEASKRTTRMSDSQRAAHNKAIRDYLAQS
ncbi:hypothetical protein [Agromyces sp. SYSU T00194]|uniref:VG15 protein n=1 Tax=Agromyces chitinivorans TaxID=3158560 RepID=UPI0033921AA6